MDELSESFKNLFNAIKKGEIDSYKDKVLEKETQKMEELLKKEKLKVKDVVDLYRPHIMARQFVEIQPIDSKLIKNVKKILSIE